MFKLDADELVEIIRTQVEDGGGMDEVMEAVENYIGDCAWERCDPELCDSDDCDYSEHNATDTLDASTDYSTSEIRTKVLRFVRELHPELADQLENT